MIRRTCQRIVTIIITCSLVCVWVRPGEACGPSFLEAVFTYSAHPDMPLDSFVQGRLGVVKPSYARSYLYAAYRQLSGLEFDQKEQRALLTLWKDRLKLGWEPSEDEWIQPWRDARAMVPGLPPLPKVSLYRNREKGNEYESYLNCQKDAFVTAANTLTDRIKRHGADSEEIRDWVQAQDTVFANCSEGQTIPNETSAARESWLKLDRAYQIAAANFYAARFAEARDQFAAIASDNSSPWWQTAEYMIARTRLRQASLGKEDDRQNALADAESKLQQILSDKRLSSQHHASARLLNLVRLRLRPEARLHELSNAILRKGAGETLKQDVWDYTVLLDKFIGDDEEEADQHKDVPATLTADDVTDWIVAFKSSTPGSLEHALQRLQQTNSLPWLVAALAKIDHRHPRAGSLLAAAERVDRRSPAFASVTFHRIRLLMEGGRDEAAREILDEILAGNRADMAHSALNLFLGQRMILARSLAEFLRDAPRSPAGFSYDEDGRELPAEPTDVGKPKEEASLLFDQDAVRVLNEEMPLSVLVAAANADVLPAHLRRDVTQAAWLRAALLDRRDEGSRLAQLLAGFYPQLKELLVAYQNETAPDARRFAATYIALKFPGLRPTVTAGLGRSMALNEVDSFRDNWWCLAGTSRPTAEEPDAKNTSSAVRHVPVFLSQSESALAATEVARLNALGYGPNYLSRTSIEWAGRRPADPRIPEALHLAVTATRRGCTDKETGRWSKAAFDLLHRRYPNNPWTRKTKYWFKD